MRYRSHHHSVGRMSAGVQLLHYFFLLRRQRQEHSLLRNRRSALRSHAADGGFPGREFLLHDGRKLPVESAARHATPGAHEGSRQELGALCFLVGECHPQVHHGRTGATGCFVDLGGTRIAQLQLRQTEEYRYAGARGGATPARYQDCLLYTSDAADEEDSVDLGGRRIIKKKKK